MITYTFTDADPNQASHIPPGEYTIQVIEFGFGLSANGNDMLNLKYKVNETGTILKDGIAFTPKSQWKFDILLKCVTPSKGIPLPQKGQEITVDHEFCTKYLLHGLGKVLVGDDSYQGRIQSKIIEYRLPPTPMPASPQAPAAAPANPTADPLF